MARPTATYRTALIQALQNDLIRGAISAAVLLVLLAAGVSLWIAIVLALLIYGGLRLMVSTGYLNRPERAGVRRPRTGHDAWVLCQVARPRVGRLVFAIDDERTAKPLAAILARVDQISGAINEDSQYEAAPMLLDLMETTIDLLTPYAKALRRGFDSGEVTQTLLRDLAVLQRALDLLWVKVNQETMATFSAVSEMIQFNLEEMSSPPRIGEPR